MTGPERDWSRFEAFYGRFAPLFGRAEAREHGRRYVLGLLEGGRRRSARSIAGSTVKGARAMERFVSESPWSDRAVIAALQGEVAKRVGGAGTAFVVDEALFPKNGGQSVGVATHPSVGPAQRGVFLFHGTPSGMAAIDRALYLPPGWIDGGKAHREGISRGLGYRSVSELALDLLREARRIGALSAPWVAAGERFGGEAGYRRALRAQGWTFVVGVPEGTRVGVAGRSRRTVTVGEIWKRVVAGSWEVEATGGCEGWRADRAVAVRVVDPYRGGGGDPSWLLIRGSGRGGQPAYALSNAGRAASMEELLAIEALPAAAARELERLRRAAGLSDYAVRGWRGWHHHTALALLAGEYLTSTVA